MAEARAGIELEVNATEAANQMREAFNTSAEEALASIEEVSQNLTGSMKEQYDKLRGQIVEMQQTLDQTESPADLMKMHNKIKRAQEEAAALAKAMGQAGFPPEAIKDADGITKSMQQLADATQRAGNAAGTTAANMNAFNRDFHAAGARSLRFAQALPNALRGADQGAQALVRNMTMLMSQSDRYGASMKQMLTQVMFSPWGLAAMTAAVLGLAINFDTVRETAVGVLNRLRVAFGDTTQEALDLAEAVEEVEKALAKDLIGELGEEQALALRSAVEESRELRTQLRGAMNEAASGVGDWDEVNMDLLQSLSDADLLTGDWGDSILEATREIAAQEEATQNLWSEIGSLRDAYGEAILAGEEFHDDAERIKNIIDDLMESVRSMNEAAAFDDTEFQIRMMDPDSLDRDLAELTQRQKEELESLEEEYELSAENIETIEQTHAMERQRIIDRAARERREARMREMDQVTRQFAQMADEMEREEEQMQQRRNRSRRRAAQIRLQIEDEAIQQDLMRLDALRLGTRSHAEQMADLREEQRRQLDQLGLEEQALSAAIKEAQGEERRALKEKLEILKETRNVLKEYHQEEENALSTQHAREVMQAYQSMGASIGNTFSNLADVMATEGERGLEQQRELAFAGAVVNAIAASIGAQRSVWESSLPLAVKIPMSAALGIQTLTDLMSQARSIYSGSPTGPSGGGTSGSFAGISAGALADRAAEQHRGMSESGEDRRREREDREGQLLGAIKDQRVILEDDTLMHAHERRKVQTSKRREGVRFTGG